MSDQREELKTIAEQLGGPPGSHSLANAMLRPVIARIAAFWWVELALGVFWAIIAIVILKFNHASVTTVGVWIGLMLLLFAAEEFALAALDTGVARWIWGFFGGLLVVAGIVSLIHPRNTFAGFADILGFVFLLVGVIWIVQAFAERMFNSLWWLGLSSGILMIVLAFWTSGEFFLGRAYTLLVFAGIWALMKAVTDIVRAFQIRELGSR